MKSKQLIEDLIKSTKSFIQTAEKFKLKSKDDLTLKQSPESWSMLECLEHLNMYADFYNPEIKAAITNSNTKTVEKFKGGIFGNYFARTILPSEKSTKLKTAKDKNPVYCNLNRPVIDQFITQQNEFLRLLEAAKTGNLNTVKTRITLTRLIKLKLGDTFRFLNNHTVRHLAQIKKIEMELAE